MKGLWILLLAPSLCTARIIQIDDLVKPGRSYMVGTTIHETSGYWFEPDRIWKPVEYTQIAMIRYEYGGMVREGEDEYLKIVVHNVLLERMAGANRTALDSSKSTVSRARSITRATVFELLVPIVDGIAFFEFPAAVITETVAQRVDAAVAALQVKDGRLVVRETARKYIPAPEMMWVPPRTWPAYDETVYLGHDKSDLYAPAAKGAAEPRDPLMRLDDEKAAR